MIRRALRKLGRAREWIHGRFPNRGAILAYHRVGMAGADPYEINVDARHFAAHMEILARAARPVSLATLHRAMDARALPPGCVAITLDDGYEDTLTVAKPVLERFGIPATSFIVSGQVGNPRGYWWDELHRVIILTPRLPEALTLSVAGATHRWRVLDDAQSAPRQGEKRMRAEKHLKRDALFWALYFLVLPLTEREWLAVLDQLAAWAGTATGVAPADRTLSADQIGELAAGGLIEIGCHTVSHPQLATLCAREQLREMRDGRARLEEIRGGPVTAFAYPHGSFDARSVAATREAGFALACTTIPNRVTPASHPLRLPRIGVPNCDAETFERTFGWLLGARPSS